MKIEELKISNFRCFGSDGVVVELEEDITAFVGNNGSGKTAVFAAIGKLFGINATQRSVRKSDFHCPNDIDEIATGTTLSIDCVLGFPELDNDEDDVAVPDVFSHMTVAGEDEPVKVRMRLVATWIDDGTPDGTIEENFRWVGSLDDDFDWDQCRRVSAIERNFVQLIYVPASRNAAEQVTNLLKGRLWRAALWSDELGEAASEASEKIQEQFADEEPAKFIAEKIEKRWQQVHFGDTHAKPEMHLVDSRLSDLVRKAEFRFYPDDTDRPRSLDDLSDGQKSLFHIALTAAILEIERDALLADPDDSVFDQQKLRRTYLTMLAIEEPENSLSPFFLSRIMEQAREIGEMAGAQVVVSSHSPSILSRVEPVEVRYARLDDATRCSSIKALTLPKRGTDARKYIRLAVRAYPELYFARFVILAEGESEAIVLPRLAEAMDVSLDRSFVPIVPLGGRFVSHFWKLLNDLSIPHATLLDLDLGRQHGGTGTIGYIVGELEEVGVDLTANSYVVSGEIDLHEIDNIDEEELIEDDQDHPWMRALQEENVFLSSPIDLDFSMLCCFPDEYMVPKAGGTGPVMTADAIKSKTEATLKTDGDPELYEGRWKEQFAWYPYHFIGGSKPEAHLAALSKIGSKTLRDDAPDELTALIACVRKAVFG